MSSRRAVDLSSTYVFPWKEEALRLARVSFSVGVWDKTTNWGRKIGRGNIYGIHRRVGVGRAVGVFCCRAGGLGLVDRERREDLRVAYLVFL